jgi:hypothetical protein
MIETHSPTPSETDFDVINPAPDFQQAVIPVRDADYYCDSVVILVCPYYGLIFLGWC